MKKFSLYRIVTIVWMGVRFFLQYYWHERRHKHDEQRRDELMRRFAVTYRETALHLEGLLIKLGQFLSARADVMPPAFTKELEELVDRVPAVPWEAVKQVLEDEWGVPYGEVLHKMSVHAVASASIGEVYHGYLHNGESVAVKIQRPGIEKIIRADFQAIRIVMWLATTFTSVRKKADLPRLYRELTAVIGDELNFHKELQNGDYFRERFAEVPGVMIPRYYEAHCTRRVLVMEWVDGAKISDLDFLQQHEIDRKMLAARLFECFARQLLFEGKFHADPHPGNLLVQADGTLVLIDFGMVGSISAADARAIRELVEGIVLQDFGKVIDCLEALRFLLPSADKTELARVLKLVVDVYFKGDLKAQNDVADRIMADVEQVVRRQPIQMPSEFAFLFRSFSTFLGVMHTVDPEADLLELGKPLVNEWLKGGEEQGSGGSSAQNWMKMAAEWGRPLLALPRLLPQYLEEPTRRREWERTRQQNEFWHDYFATKKRHAFLCLLISLLALAVSAHWSNPYMLYGSGFVFVVSGLFYLVHSRRHFRFIRDLQQAHQATRT